MFWGIFSILRLGCFFVVVERNAMSLRKPYLFCPEEHEAQSCTWSHVFRTQSSTITVVCVCCFGQPDLDCSHFCVSLFASIGQPLFGRKKKWRGGAFLCLSEWDAAVTLVYSDANESVEIEVGIQRMSNIDPSTLLNAPTTVDQSLMRRNRREVPEETQGTEDAALQRLNTENRANNSHLRTRETHMTTTRGCLSWPCGLAVKRTL